VLADACLLIFGHVQDKKSVLFNGWLEGRDVERKREEQSWQLLFTKEFLLNVCS